MIYNIATLMSPKPGFIPRLREIAKDDNIPLLACIVVEGPGCCNVAVMLEGENDAWAKTLCMVLQPAKYSAYKSDPAIAAGQFEDRR